MTIFSMEEPTAEVDPFKKPEKTKKTLRTTARPVQSPRQMMKIRQAATQKKTRAQWTMGLEDLTVISESEGTDDHVTPYIKPKKTQLLTPQSAPGKPPARLKKKCTDAVVTATGGASAEEEEADPNPSDREEDPRHSRQQW